MPRERVDVLSQLAAFADGHGPPADALVCAAAGSIGAQHERCSDGATDILAARARRGLWLSRGVHPRVPRSVRRHAGVDPRARPTRQHRTRGAHRHGPNTSRRPRAAALRQASVVSDRRSSVSATAATTAPRFHRSGSASCRASARSRARSAARHTASTTTATTTATSTISAASRSRASLRLDRSWTRLRIPEQRYAVFTHRGHVSTIRRTHNTIWTTWLPQSGHDVADAPHFERYGDDFDGQAGVGGIEVWLPIGG